MPTTQLDPKEAFERGELTAFFTELRDTGRLDELSLDGVQALYEENPGSHELERVVGELTRRAIGAAYQPKPEEVEKARDNHLAWQAEYRARPDFADKRQFWAVVEAEYGPDPRCPRCNYRWPGYAQVTGSRWRCIGTIRGVKSDGEHLNQGTPCDFRDDALTLWREQREASGNAD